MSRRYEQYCALATALDLLGDRWTLLILRELWSGPKRFNALERGLVDSPTNVLSSRLRDLTEAGLVDARVPADDRRGRVYQVRAEVRDELGDILTALTRFGAARLSAGPVGARPFRPEWLVLPLEALLRREAVPRPVTVRFSTGTESGQFTISSDGVELSPDTDADVTVEGTPDALLHALRAPDHIAHLLHSGALVVTGDGAAVRTLQRALGQV
jgi:DNA-binding HxlR family transcriptional regulator